MATFTSLGTTFNEPQNTQAELFRNALQSAIGNKPIVQFQNPDGTPNGTLSGGSTLTPGLIALTQDFIDSNAGVRTEFQPSQPDKRQKQARINRNPSASGRTSAASGRSSASASATSQLAKEALPEIIALARNIASRGGTNEAKNASNDLASLRNDLQNTFNMLSVENAKGLAGDAVQEVLRQFREVTFPKITAISEAAGTSKSALRALLTQDAEARAGGQAAKLILDTVARFAELQNQNASQQVAAAQTPVSDQLLKLLQVAPEILTNTNNLIRTKTGRGFASVSGAQNTFRNRVG